MKFVRLPFDPVNINFASLFDAKSISANIGSTKSSPASNTFMIISLFSYLSRFHNHIRYFYFNFFNCRFGYIYITNADSKPKI